LYLPTAAMLLGLILRGVAFEFRVKARAQHKDWWERAFAGGSLLASLAQGYMLGSYIVGFDHGLGGIAFSLLVAVCLAAGYALIGAGWLIMRAEGDLQKRSVRWALWSLRLAALGMAAVSLATPLASPRIFEKWFEFPTILLLAPVPLVTAALFVALEVLLRRLPQPNDAWCWVPFAGTVGLYLLGFGGLAYSFFPYVVPERLTIWQAASAPESLVVILVGVVVVLPAILGYTAFSYRVFWGKLRELTYG
jgi:cytochrome d ubiquinol oxidase subunit II